MRCGELRYGELKYGKFRYGELKCGKFRYGKMRYGSLEMGLVDDGGRTKVVKGFSEIRIDSFKGTILNDGLFHLRLLVR